jgi:glycosyltransferase involved in cell wall biosynthesis
MGGIAAVVNTYRSAGMTEASGVKYLATHRDGSRLRKLTTFARALCQMLALLALHRPALVHIHTSSRASFWRKSILAGLSLSFGVPYVIHLHGSEFRQFFEQECPRFAQGLVRLVFARAAAVIALSTQWRTWVAGHCPNARIEVIYNPVQLPETPAAGKAPEERGMKTVLFLGRLGQRKGTMDLLQAFSCVADEFPDARLVLAGDGAIEEASAQAARLGLGGRVSCPGWVTGARKSALLQHATVYVLPSYDEGLPISVLEAMAHGLPVLTTPVGGIPEAITDGANGLLVPPGDVPALAAALRRLLGDASLCAALGRAARKTVMDRFEANLVVAQVHALHDELSGRALAAGLSQVHGVAAPRRDEGHPR